MEKLSETMKDLEQGKISADNAEEQVLRLFNVMPSLPLDRSFYRQCNECLRWRMIGTQCKNPLTMMCDNDERYFYKGNVA